MADWKNPKTKDKFYGSKEWKIVRKLILARRPLCVHCLSKNVFTPATEIDHIIDISERPDLRLTISNLQPLCKECHSKKTALTDNNSEKGLTLVNRKWNVEIRNMYIDSTQANRSRVLQGPQPPLAPSTVPPIDPSTTVDSEPKP